MTELRRGTPSPTPRARLDRVPPSVRHLWSLLYRATRRHAARVDRLTRFVRAATAQHRRELDQLHHRARGVDERLADEASLLGESLRRADEAEGQRLALRLRVDDLDRRVTALEHDRWGAP